MNTSKLAEFLSEDILQSLKEENILEVALLDFFNTLLEQEDYMAHHKDKYPDVRGHNIDNDLVSTFYGLTNIDFYVERVWLNPIIRYGRTKGLTGSSIRKLIAYKNLEHQYNCYHDHDNDEHLLTINDC